NRTLDAWEETKYRVEPVQRTGSSKDDGTDEPSRKDEWTRAKPPRPKRAAGTAHITETTQERTTETPPKSPDAENELDFVEVALHKRFKPYLARGGWSAPNAETFSAAEVEIINRSGLTGLMARQAAKDGLWPPGEPT